MRVATALLIATLVFPLAAVAEKTVIRAGYVVDPDTGRVAEKQTLVIENGKISAIGADVDSPAGAEEVEIFDKDRVTLRAAEADEIAAYVATGEPMDKAGAYAYQGEGGRFVERVDGSRSNVIGLPLAETLALLAEAGVVDAAAPERWRDEEGLAEAFAGADARG